MRAVRATVEILAILLIAWASIASSEDDGGGGGGDDDNGGGPGGTPQACASIADCGGRPADLCAGYDACVAGICVWQEPVSCGGTETSPCATRSCDPATGACRTEPLGDGTACEDGDPCTLGETCQAGRCVGGAPCDDGNPCTTDSCDPGIGCVAAWEAEGTPCDTGNACLVDGVCDEWGSCRGTQRVCDDGDVCTYDRCDGDTGCVHDPVGDGTACDDGNPCTGPDACRAGRCETPAFEDGIACDDGNPCTGATVCRGGVCAEGTPIGDGGACDDGDPCTQGTLCAEGVCGAGEPVTCEDDGNPCTEDACVPGDGCVYLPVPVGTSCEPANPNAASACVVSHACEGTQCLPGETAPNGTPCEDGDPCTDGSVCQGGACVEGTRLGDGAACDDGNPCTEQTACQSGSCGGGTAVDCGPSTLCANPWCDPEQGCVVQPAGEGLPCDDDDPCTTEDVCRDGACVGEAFCDDGDPCTVDGCSGATCTYEWEASEACPYEATCDDGADDDGDGRIDCAVASCARLDDACRTAYPFPTRISFDDGFAPGFGTTYDPALPGHPRWAIDGVPAPGGRGGGRSLNFNDAEGAAWDDALTADELSAGLCCWQGGYEGLPVYVTWMEYVDLPTDEETAASDVLIRRAFRFVRHDEATGVEVVLTTATADRGHWRRRIVENPAHDEIGGFGVAWSLSVPFEGFDGGVGWFVDDVEILRAEDCANEVDDNGNGDVDCDDALCDTWDECAELVCDDGIDDNEDGDTDCDDQDCAGAPACL